MVKVHSEHVAEKRPVNEAIEFKKIEEQLLSSARSWAHQDVHQPGQGEASHREDRWAGA